MNRRVIIIGAGGHAMVVADVVRSAGDIVVGFFDDSKAKGSDYYGASVLGSIEDCAKYKDEYEAIIAIGNNETRKEIAEKYSLNWYTAIHKSAVVSPSASLGCGTVVMPLAIVNANASVGLHAIVNSGAIVEHDCKIGSYTQLASGSVLCGGSLVGENVLIGAGATVTVGARVADNERVEPNGVVYKDI